MNESQTLEGKTGAESDQTGSHLTNCEDCGCLVHVDVYNLHKKDKICENKGVCGICWKGYYDKYIEN